MADRDYDVLRGGDLLEAFEDVPEELKGRRSALQSGQVDADTDLSDPIDLPGADLSGLAGVDMDFGVRPRQRDEFTCTSCFLVLHRSRLASRRASRSRCRDCA